MPDAYMEYQHESGVTARWHGGPYIELGHVAEEDTGPFNDKGDPSYYAGEFVALDAINVWDIETDEPTIPRTLDALQQAVDEYFEEDEDDEEDEDMPSKADWHDPSFWR